MAATAATEPIRIVVMSDIHAVEAGSATVSKETKDDPEENALTAARELVSEYRISADLLLCPGDLTNRAHPDALDYCWGELNKIAKELGATLIATSGNHDLDSQHVYSGYDTLGALKDLDPRFPVDDRKLQNQFFSEQVTVLELDHTRALVVDTCHFHSTTDDQAERERGRVGRRGVLAIEEALGEDARGKLHLLVCHHQPVRWNPEPYPVDLTKMDQSEAVGGTYLVEALERFPHQPWLLVHGHRHTPAIGYLGNTTAGPIRFAAGTFGGAPPTSSKYPNQFYLLEIWPEGTSGEPLRTAGRFRAWDWLEGGWQDAEEESGIPGAGGFGYRANGRDLATWVTQLGNKHLYWDDLVAADPRLDYLAPCDMRAFERTLDRDGHGCITDENGRIEEIALR